MGDSVSSTERRFDGRPRLLRTNERLISFFFVHSLPVEELWKPYEDLKGSLSISSIEGPLYLLK